MPTPTLPLVRGNLAQALYPFVARIEFDTGIFYSADGTEQRWKRRSPLFRFQFSYANLVAGDRTGLLNFFNQEKGAFAANWQAALSTVVGIGGTIGNLTFEHDEISLNEPEPLLYEVGLRVSQRQNRAFAIPSVSATFPTLSGGTITSYPYAMSWRNLTSYGDSPTGSRYAFAWWNGGLTGLPNRSLRRFILSNPVLVDADVTTLVQFFVGMQGRLTTFSFTDPDSGTTYTNCHFQDDVLEIHYMGPSLTQLQMAVVEAMN